MNTLSDIANVLNDGKDIKIVENQTEQSQDRRDNETEITEKRNSLEQSTLHGTRFKELTTSKEPMMKSQFAISEIKIDRYTKNKAASAYSKSPT